MNKVKKYVELLTSVEPDTLAKIEKYEAEGKFNDHLDTNPAPYIPVDKDYEYLPQSIFRKLDYSLKRLFFLKPLIKETNKQFDTIVVGKENLKNINSAIICSNHINKLDCLALEYALKPHITYYTAAEFNNMKGFIGDMMRANRMLPMSANMDAKKNFLKAIEKLLNKNSYVTFFPEGSEWWCYEKPRPQLSGAYHIAVKNNVPVIPVFITFNQTYASKKSPTGLKQFVVNILKPIYPNTALSMSDNIKIMMDDCKNQWEETYKNFYKKDL